MSSATFSVFYGAEPILLLIALFALWRSKERRRFSALFVYCALRLSSYLVLEGLLHASAFTQLSKGAVYKAYFWTYWSTYLADAILVFFVLHELFQLAMEPLPGLKRLGSITFRWITGVSFVAALAAVIDPRASGYTLLVAVCGQIMRCESIFTLCLLLFLMAAAGKLGLSYSSRVFGLSFGFGIMGASNLVASALLLNSKGGMWAAKISVMDTGASLFALLIWSAYLLRKEPNRQAISLPIASPLARWNEIAAALGQTSGRPVMASSSSDFFLQDVEKVVDRILIKNSLNAAS